MNYYRRRMKPLLLSLLSLFLFSSCGFRNAYYTHKEEPLPIQVPFVEGDRSGKVTSLLIEQLEKSGHFSCTDNGLYILKVKLVDDKHETIGFRHKPKDSHNKIIPNETRVKQLAQISLLEKGSNKTVFGPFYILSQAEYDHQNYSIDQDINHFSLGQLSDIDTSHEVLDIPVFRNLAEQINMFLISKASMLPTKKA